MAVPWPIMYIYRMLVHVLPTESSKMPTEYPMLNVHRQRLDAYAGISSRPNSTSSFLCYLLQVDRPLLPNHASILVYQSRKRDHSHSYKA
jgi:hypothetical protein